MMPDEAPRELARACDAHLHIIDARFPSSSAAMPAGMTLDDYTAVQNRLGLSRAVVVQAKPFGTDHACLLDALSRLGANGRGIAVVRPDVDDAELRRLDAGGVRGLRFSVWNQANTVTTPDMIEPLANRITGLGWHVQLHAMGDQIVALAPMLGRLACPVVFDHMGRLPPQQGIAHPAFGVIARLLDQGKSWVKLAGPYLNTTEGPPAYADAARVAEAFVKHAPERLLWGSDWPHVTEAHKPDDAGLLDLLRAWAGDEATRNRILVDNPEQLYGFG